MRDGVINHYADSRRIRRGGESIDGLLLASSLESIPDRFVRGATRTKEISRSEETRERLAEITVLFRLASLFNVKRNRWNRQSKQSFCNFLKKTKNGGNKQQSRANNERLIFRLARRKQKGSWPLYIENAQKNTRELLSSSAK